MSYYIITIQKKTSTAFREKTVALLGSTKLNYYCPSCKPVYAGVNCRSSHSFRMVVWMYDQDFQKFCWVKPNKLISIQN